MTFEILKTLDKNDIAELIPILGVRKKFIKHWEEAFVRVESGEKSNEINVSIYCQFIVVNFTPYTISIWNKDFLNKFLTLILTTRPNQEKK